MSIGLLVIGAAGCGLSPDNQQTALDQATGIVRGAASAMLTRLQAVSDPSAAGAAVQDLVANPKPGTTTVVLEQGSSSPGRFDVDVAFFAMGESGSGDGMAQVTVRLCVSYVAKIGPDTQVGMSDLVCPAQASTSGFGFPASTVKLEG